jgi:hypothetical protein
MSDHNKTTDLERAAMPYRVIETESRKNKFWVVDHRGDAELGNWFIACTWYRPHAEMIAEALNGRV